MSPHKTVSTLAPKLEVLNGHVWTTSMDIAEHFEKQHKDVLRAIRSLIGHTTTDFSRRNFALTLRKVHTPQGAGRDEEYYRLSRNGFAMTAFRFTGRRAVQWQEAYVRAFEAMEQALVGQAPEQRVQADADLLPNDPMATPLFRLFMRATGRRIGQSFVLTLLVGQGGLHQGLTFSIRTAVSVIGAAVGRTSINKATKRLEAFGLLSIDRSFGRGFVYTIQTPELYRWMGARGIDRSQFDAIAAQAQLEHQAAIAGTPSTAGQLSH